MGEAQLPFLGGTIIKKSNMLVRARWRPGSVWEPRLVALLASKVRADDTDLHGYAIHISEIMPERVTGGKDYREIESAIEP